MRGWRSTAVVALALNYLFAVKGLERQPGLTSIMVVGIVLSFVASVCFHAPAAVSQPWRQRDKIVAKLGTGIHLVIVNGKSAPCWVHNGADFEQAHVLWAHSRGKEKDCELIVHFSGRQAWWTGGESARLNSETGC